LSFIGIDTQQLTGNCLVIMVLGIFMVIKNMFRMIMQLFQSVYEIIRSNMFSAIEFIVIYLHCFIIFRSIDLSIRIYELDRKKIEIVDEFGVSSFTHDF
jgi:hypothetical protein